MTVMIAGMWLSGLLKPVKDEIMKRGGEERALRRIMTVTKKNNRQKRSDSVPVSPVLS